MFLVLCISNDFLLYSEYFKYYVVKRWVLLKSSIEIFFLSVCFSRQLSWLGSQHRSPSVCGDSSVYSGFTAFAICGERDRRSYLPCLELEWWFMLYLSSL